MESIVRRASEAGLTPGEEDEVDIELDDPTIDEARLPPMDMDDAEALGHEGGYDDLLDRDWLERAADEDVDDDRGVLDLIGLTIELNGPSADDDAAQIVDLDVGSLLTSLPGDGTELDLDMPGEPGHGGADGSLAIGALRGMLLPDGDDEADDDDEIGNDDRFPVFDDSADIEPRGRGGAEDEPDAPDGDDLS